jgi:hypothetical protein
VLIGNGAAPFERYADDAIVHCRTEQEAEGILVAIRERFAECGLMRPSSHEDADRVLQGQQAARASCPRAGRLFEPHLPSAPGPEPFS